MSRNEKYFLNSSDAALSSFQLSGRITADMRLAPQLGALPNCHALLRNFSYPQTLYTIQKIFF